MATSEYEESANLEVLNANLARIETLTQRLIAAFAKKQPQRSELQAPDPSLYLRAASAYWQEMVHNPSKVLEQQVGYWGKTLKHFVEAQEALREHPLVAPEDNTPEDKRFSNPLWRTHPYFNYIKQQYLMSSEAIEKAIDELETLDAREKRRLEYFGRQIIDMMAPTNFLGTNPDALMRAVETEGASLVKGLENLVRDIEANNGDLLVTLADRDAFKVGGNIGTSEGAVVFRNRMFELIQYKPTTEQVHETPLLIFPPWINKFYILDLQPKNSMIRWLLDQGHTVFLVSWVNPGEDMAEVTFEDYMREGVYAAVDAVQQAAGVDRVNAVGYCVGGTLLAAALAHMAKTGDEHIQSATFFASQADFKCAGDLLVFSDEQGIKFLEDKIDQHGGVLDAQTMADTFNALRSNDLIWNYVVDNYYIGKQPPPFDLLYWNADQTRMPKALHLFYLRRFYRDNALTSGELELLGQKLSLKDVNIPIFMQSSKEDHIAPAASVYNSAKAFGGPVEYIVAGSGHIAGVINHPDAKKYQYWTGESLHDALPDWQANAVEHPGSWWPHWDAWLRERSGPDTPARTPGEGGLPVLGDAPGEYVKVRSDAD